MITKSNSDKFKAEIFKILEKYGFRKTTKEDGYSYYNYIIERERFGKLYFSVHDEEGASFYSVFGRFETPNEFTNKYFGTSSNGKYNFHLTKNMKNSIDSFERELLYIFNSIAKDV